MDILSPQIRNTTTTTETKLPDSIKNWQVGQILEVKATSPTRDGVVELEINGQKFLVSTEKDILPNQLLKVRVSSIGNPSIGGKIELTVLDEKQASLETKIANFLNKHIPKQDTSAPLLNNLQHALKNPKIIRQISNSQQIPNPQIDSPKPSGENIKFENEITNLIKNIINNIPKEKSFTAKNIASETKGEIVKNFLNDSGIAFEHKIKNSLNTDNTKIEHSKVIETDLKANLLKLKAALEKADSEITTKSKESITDNSIKKLHSSLVEFLKADVSKAMQSIKSTIAPNIINLIKKEIQNNSENALLQQIKPPPPLPQYPLNAKANNNKTIDSFLGTRAIITELLNQVESAISRTSISQTSQQRTDGLFHAIFDIPVIFDDATDVFHLRVSEEESGKDPRKKRKNQRYWNIEMAFDIPPLGNISTRIKLDEKKVRTLIWAENNKTADIVNQYIPILNRQLESTGLKVENTVCHCGTPPNQDFQNSISGGFYEKA